MSETNSVPATGWQPIETAPKGRAVFFWTRYKTVDDDGVIGDTSGKAILMTGEPKRIECKFGGWSSLRTATHWMEPPLPPTNANLNFNSNADTLSESKKKEA